MRMGRMAEGTGWMPGFPLTGAGLTPDRPLKMTAEKVWE